MTRVIVGTTVAAVLGAALGLPLLIAVAVPAACLSGAPAVAGQLPADLGLDPEQSANARTIVSVVVSRRMPSRAAVIAIATAMQESGLRNLTYGDRDSLGLFQQRPSMGWGAPEQVMDPVHATGRFLDALLTVPGWQSRDMADVTWQVQRYDIRYADRYAANEPRATAVVSALLSDPGSQPSGLPAGGAAPGGIPAGDNTSILIVGDSITVGARSRVELLLAGLPVTIDARVGRTAAQGAALLASSPAARAAGTWIVALGTNDLAASQAAFSGVIRDVLAAAGGRRVVWVTAFGTGRFAAAHAGVNAAIRSAAAAGLLEIADWAAIAGDPGQQPTDGSGALVPPDEVHPGPAGSRRYAELLASAVTGGSGSGPRLDCQPISSAGVAAGSAYSAAAGVALAAAIDQLGEPYTYDARPPDTWDCSKLTAWAWGRAGVTLTAYSYAQAEQTDRVCTGADACRRDGVLLPGDLLFYFVGDAHHVAMYLGAGRIIEASSPATGVRTTDAWNPWAAAHFSFAGRVRGYPVTTADTQPTRADRTSRRTSP